MGWGPPAGEREADFQGLLEDSLRTQAMIVRPRAERESTRLMWQQSTQARHIYLGAATAGSDARSFSRHSVGEWDGDLAGPPPGGTPEGDDVVGHASHPKRPMLEFIAVGDVLRLEHVEVPGRVELDRAVRDG